MLDTVLRVLRALSAADAGWPGVEALFRAHASPALALSHRTIAGQGGATTDLVRVSLAGSRGRLGGGDAPTLGVLGRLGGVGARPARIGFVSDGDGAAAALAVALEAAMMAAQGDAMPGDLIVSTHICPRSPVVAHRPVPFMGSPVAMAEVNAWDVRPEMDAILSIDTTKGNRIMNHRGIAITPTAKDGYVLKASRDLLDVYEAVCGVPPRVLAITTQDILPYGTGIDHLNSIMQPATATAAPVAGVAITTETAVAGSQPNASHEGDIALAARFALEAAYRFGSRDLHFYDEDEYGRIVALYGSLAHLRTVPAPPAPPAGT